MHSGDGGFWGNTGLSAGILYNIASCNAGGGGGSSGGGSSGSNGSGGGGSGYKSPRTIRYSQDSIGPNFKDGRSVLDLADGLSTGAVDPGSIPPIRIFNRDGRWFSLDNRRLAAFDLAGVDAPYVLATPDEIAREAWKFTTKNNGDSIRIRRLNIKVGGNKSP